MDRWLADAKNFESTMDEKYKQITRDILQDVISRAKNFYIFKEILRWCDMFQVAKVNGFRSEDEIWVGCPIKDEIVKSDLAIWKNEFNYTSIEFEEFMVVFSKLAPLKFNKIITGDYN